jgi:phosphohistidine phosphatase
LADFDRPLKVGGRDDARQIGEFMAAHRLLPGRALISTALRARETFDLVDIFLHPPPERVDESRIYEATADALFDIVRALPAGQPSVLLVGHNPAFEELANELISGDEPSASQSHLHMPTGALAVIDFAADRWNKVERGGGTLALFVTPGHAGADK